MANIELFEYYAQDCYEDGRLGSDNAHTLEYLTSMRYLRRTLPYGARLLDACAGTGTYSYALAEEGYRVTASDLIPHNIDFIRRKQEGRPALEGIYTCDVRAMTAFPDESFDGVLCMGALYHLPIEEHPAAVRECLRVLKPGGIFAAAYINKYAQVLVGLARNGKEAMAKYIHAYHTNCRDLFYRYSPAETEAMMAEFPLEKLYNIGTDGIGYAIPAVINSLTPDEFAAWRDYHYETCEEPTILGYSLHALYIGRKNP